MNGTGSLLQKSGQFLWRHPIVLLPVMAARLLDFAMYWVCGLLRIPVTKAVAPHSVLGGLSGKVNGPVVLVAYFFTLFPLLFEVAVLLYGMLVSGRWAHSLRESDAQRVKTWNVPPADVSRASFITFSVGAITAVVGLYLSVHGGVPARWSYMVTWCFLLLAGWFILPSWLRALAHVQGVRLRDTSRLPPYTAMALGLAAFAACVYAGVAIEHSLEVTHRVHTAVVPFVINLVAACFSVVPLTFSAIALSRYVADRPGWQTE